MSSIPGSVVFKKIGIRSIFNIRYSIDIQYLVFDRYSILVFNRYSNIRYLIHTKCSVFDRLSNNRYSIDNQYSIVIFSVMVTTFVSGRSDLSPECVPISYKT